MQYNYITIIKISFTLFVNIKLRLYFCIMKIEYEKDYLEELYTSGKCKNNKYRFQQSVIRKYQMRIDTLIAATRIEDLFVFNSLNFEALDNGYYSVRIDFHYRLVFKIREEGSEPRLTVCAITDITNHYR